MIETSLGFIGSGQMARALATSFVNAGLIAANRISAHDPVEAARHQFAADVQGAALVENNRRVVADSQIVFLATKPQHMTSVFDEIRGLVTKDVLVVSIAAGVTLQTLTAGLGTERVVRVMPNTPCLVGQGAAGYAISRGASEADATLVGRLLQSCGIAIQVDESLLDAVTGLSGSGPAFVYLLIEALSDGGVSAGLPRHISTQLAAQTVRGAAEMVLTTEEHPGVLKDRVASPAGTTIAGLCALEQRGFRGAAMEAVCAAAARATELGSQ